MISEPIKEDFVNNSLYVDNEDLDWLELDDIPTNLKNPLLTYDSLTRDVDPVEEFVSLLMNPNYLHFTAKIILNVTLLPYQMVIIDALWRKRLPMVIGSRGGAKSYILAVYCLLKMILNPGCRIVIIGAGLRQARGIHDYMAKVWENAPVLRDIAGKSKSAGPRRETDRFQFEIGISNCVALPLGSDGTKIRGQRANIIVADEFASIPEEIFNLVVQGFAVVSQDPVEKVKQAARTKKLKQMGRWTEDLERLRVETQSGNQIIYSGTAFYQFNHFYKYFKKWHNIIETKGDQKKLTNLFGDSEAITRGFNWKDYCIVRFPYHSVPEGLLDSGMLAQAKATLSRQQFLMEYCGVFVTDSDGFYKRSIIEAATTNKPIQVSSGTLVQFSSLRQGDPHKVYVMGVDPAADKDNAAIIILEIYEDHRRIVHCWTTNRMKHEKIKTEMKKNNIIIEDDYYRYIARKIRSLMKVFNIERIMMDKNGGGIAIGEALRNKKECEELEEIPVYTVIDPEDPKGEDQEKGVHILDMVIPTQDMNSEANHGMLKDMQDKVLLFPLFDVIELAKSYELDKLNNIIFDTYEDLVNEIEELKLELESIVVTQSSNLGKETFDTPAIKGAGMRKGRLHKDRFSALLYANYYARSKGGNKAYKIEYKATGGTKDNRIRTTQKNSKMYYGLGAEALGDGNPSWMNGQTFKFVKHK